MFVDSQVQLEKSKFGNFFNNKKNYTSAPPTEGSLFGTFTEDLSLLLFMSIFFIDMSNFS